MQVDDVHAVKAALTRSCTVSAYSQTSNNAAAAMHAGFPSRRASYNTIVRSATGVDSSQRAMSSRNNLAKRVRRELETCGDRNGGKADRIPAACQSCLVSLGDASIPQSTSMGTATAPNAEAASHPCMRVKGHGHYACDRAVQGPPVKHPRGDSMLHAQPSGFSPMCEDSITGAPAVRPHVPACPLITKAASVPAQKKDLGFGGSYQQNCGRGDAHRVPAPVVSVAPAMQESERPSMFDIWDFIRQGAGQPITSASAASIAAFSCDGPFSRPPLSATHTGAGC